METQGKKSPLRTPTPEQSELSFCKPSVREVKTWIQNLPKANIGETARLLYQALNELNNFKTNAENRIQLLELLRPEVFFVNAQLERHFLNNAVMLDDRAKKVANLCQSLQSHLSMGYKLVIADIFQQRSPILALALQRTLHSLSASLVRAHQLYYPAPANLWFELHQSYLLARTHNLHTIAVRDSLLNSVKEQSVEAAYSCALLLSCSRINQMRQSDITILSQVLPSWCHLAAIQNANLTSSLFVINLQSDSPPHYKALMNSIEGQTILGFDTHNLASALIQHQQTKQASSLQIPVNMPSSLIAQLCSAWGNIAKRDFQRTASQGSLELCLGMSAVHYYLSDQNPFEQTLRSQQPVTAKYTTDNSPPDVWANTVDTNIMSSLDPLQSELIEYEPLEKKDDSYTENNSATIETNSPLYPTYTFDIINTSPGGYCLAISNNIPAPLQAGELIALREDPSKSWITAVIRWLRQVNPNTTQIGVELIAANAQPCGLQLLRSSGQASSFLRALLVPEISALSRPARVIALRVPFQEGHKVVINQSGKEMKATLSTRSIHTGSISQFEYRLSLATPAVDQYSTRTNNEAFSSEDFDSLWKSL